MRTLTRPRTAVILSPLPLELTPQEPQPPCVRPRAGAHRTQPATPVSRLPRTGRDACHVHDGDLAFERRRRSQLDDWRTTPAGAASADRVRNWLDYRIAEIEKGDIARARNALADPGWRANFDLTGVPMEALARVDGFVEAACDALADRDLDPDAATRALRAARVTVTPASR